MARKSADAAGWIFHNFQQCEKLSQVSEQTFQRFLLWKSKTKKNKNKKEQEEIRGAKKLNYFNFRKVEIIG